MAAVSREGSFVVFVLKKFFTSSASIVAEDTISLRSGLFFRILQQLETQRRADTFLTIPAGYLYKVNVREPHPALLRCISRAEDLAGKG